MTPFTDIVSIATDASRFETIQNYTVGDIEDVLHEICIFAQRFNDKVIFIFANGCFFTIAHEQEVTEDVTLVDMNGDLDDFIFYPLLLCETRTSNVPEEQLTRDSSETWTFHTLRCLGGSLDLRWFGSSNGYYSETAEVTVAVPCDDNYTQIHYSAHQKAGLITQAQKYYKSKAA
jgi:hypothetical protein